MLTLTAHPDEVTADRLEDIAIAICKAVKIVGWGGLNEAGRNECRSAAAAALAIADDPDRPSVELGIAKRSSQRNADAHMFAARRARTATAQRDTLIDAISSMEPTWHQGMYGCREDMFSAGLIRQTVTNALAPQPSDI